jgi:hypothetical protein
VKAAPPEGRVTAFERAIGRQAARVRNDGKSFSSPAGTTLPRGRDPGSPAFLARQENAAPPSSAALRPPRGAGPTRPPSGDRHEGRDGRGHAEKDITVTTDRDDHDFEQPQTSSPTDQVLTELQLYGYRPFQDEPDPRPLPEAEVIAGAVADIFDALVATLSDTRLEPDLEDLLWSTVNVFHRAIDRIERELDDNEQAHRRSQEEQDGSEVRSVELERLTAQGLTLTERRNTMEFFRDQAADQFERHTGSAWRPRSGSMVNHRMLTASMIDSRDFIAAKRRAEHEVLLPAGPKIAVTGGLDFNDHRAIWDRLDKVHAKHPDMVLLHGGSPKGAERIAACWADSRKVPQIAFKPDWARYAKAAPFKRNPRHRGTSAAQRCDPQASVWGGPGKPAPDERLRTGSIRPRLRSTPAKGDNSA